MGTGRIENLKPLIAVTDKAKTGDVEAARYVRDTIGEKPREGLELGNLDDKPLETVDLS